MDKLIIVIRRPAKITRDVRALVRPEIEVIESEVLAINPAARPGRIGKNCKA